MRRKKSAIYLRKSRSDEGIEALRKHKEMLIRLADSKGLHYEIYEEIGSSISLDVRDELNRLFANIDQYENVIVMDIDRLSRSLADMEQIKNLFIDKEIKIITPSQVIDLSVDSQELMVDFQSVIANAEYKQIKKRMRRGRIEGARAGNWVAGVTPLGYNIDKKSKKLVPNKDELPLVREIFRMALTNQTPADISDQLNKRGYKTRKGNKFTAYAIQTILSNMAYIGYVVYRENPDIKGRKPEEVVTPNAHTAIISELDYLEVQKLLKARRTNHGRNSALYRTYLQGLVFCAECGRQMTIQFTSADKEGRNVDSINFQACRTEGCKTQGISCKEVEEAVRVELYSLKSKVFHQFQQLKGQDNRGKEVEYSTLIAKHQSEIKRGEGKLDNLLDLQLDGAIDKDTYSKKKAEIQQDIQELRQEIKRLELSIQKLDKDSQSNMLLHTMRMIDKIDIMDKEEANRWLKTIIARIEYSRPKPNSLRRSAKGEPVINIIAM